MSRTNYQKVSSKFKEAFPPVLFVCLVMRVALCQPPGEGQKEMGTLLLPHSLGVRFRPFLISNYSIRHSFDVRVSGGLTSADPSQ